MFHSKIFMLWDLQNQFGNYNINNTDLYQKLMQPFVTKEGANFTQHLVIVKDILKKLKIRKSLIYLYI